MLTFPMKFQVSANASPGIKTRFEAKAHTNSPITCAIPPEFNGPGGGYSPEDLYALSLATCFLATFKVFAEKTQAAFEQIEAVATLMIERNEKGVPTLSHIDLFVTVTGVKDREKIQKMCQEAEKNCLVSKALTSTIRYNYQIS